MTKVCYSCKHSFIHCPQQTRLLKQLGTSGTGANHLRQEIPFHLSPLRVASVDLHDSPWPKCPYL